MHCFSININNNNEDERQHEHEQEQEEEQSSAVLVHNPSNQVLQSWDKFKYAQRKALILINTLSVLLSIFFTLWIFVVAPIKFYFDPSVFQVESFTVPSISKLNNHNINNQTWMMEFNLTLSVRSLVKDELLLFQSLKVSIQHDTMCLASTNLKPFQVEKKGKETMQIDLLGTDHDQTILAFIHELEVAKGGGVLEFIVKVEGQYLLLQQDNDKARTCKLLATCNAIAVEFSSINNVTTNGSGTLLGIVEPCIILTRDDPYCSA